MPDVLHMSLATCLDNKPWVCEIHFVYDDDLNFYFLSKPDRRHSKEISLNPNVAGDIIKQHGLDDRPRGIYFEGKAEMLGRVEKEDIPHRLYEERFSIGPEMLDEINNDPAGHKFYKITPELFVVFDAVNSPDNPRQEWRP